MAQSPHVTLETEQEKAAEPAKEATPIEDAEGVDGGSNDVASNDAAAAANEKNVSVASDVSCELGQTINAKVGKPVPLKGTRNSCYLYSHKWEVTSNNASDATITNNDEAASVTFSKPGTYKIKHTYCKNSNWHVTNHSEAVEFFTVEVSDNTVTDLTISGESSVKQFETIQLTTNASDVTWSSSNPKVAEVDQSGNVKGIAQGTVTITA